MVIQGVFLLVAPTQALMLFRHPLRCPGTRGHHLGAPPRHSGTPLLVIPAKAGIQLTKLLIQIAPSGIRLLN